MAIAVQSVSTTAFATSATISLTKPTGTVDGDLLIGFLANEGGQTVNSVPSGWTQIATVTEVNGDRIYMYWKEASSEPASWSFGYTASTERFGGVLRVDGQVPTTPTDQSATGSATNTATPSFSNTITPTYADSLLVMAIVGNDITTGTASGYAIATSNPTWTERIELFNAGTGMALFVATAVRPEKTATGNSSANVVNATADTACILASFIAQSNISVTGSVGSLALNGNVGSVSGAANVSGSVGSLNLNGNVGTPTQPEADWKNVQKSSEGTTTNIPKT